MAKASPRRRGKLAAAKKATKVKGGSVRDLGVDDFLQGKHLDAEEPPCTAPKRPTARKRPRDEDEDGVEGDHRAELDALKEKDPEFYAFLKENDEELLEFEAEEDDEDEEGEEEEQEGEGKSELDKEKKKKKGVLTMERLERLSGASRRKTKRMIGVLRCCVASAEEDVPLEVLEPEVRVRGVEVALEALRGLSEADEPAAVRATLKLTSKALKLRAPSGAPSGVERAAARKLGGLTMTDRWGPRFVRLLVDRWAVPIEAEDDDDDSSIDQLRGLQVDCYLRLRELVERPSFEEVVLRKAYAGFARRVASASSNPLKAAKRAAAVSFAAACVADLYARAPTHSYRLAFGYVRELALKVRTGLARATSSSSSSSSAPKEESQVVSWRFAHAVRCWSSAASSDPSLEPLIFPLCQICFAATELAMSPDAAPFKLHMVRCLHALAAASKLYVPTTRVLLNLLSHLAGRARDKRQTTSTTHKGSKDAQGGLTTPQIAHRIAHSVTTTSSDGRVAAELFKETCDLLGDWLELVRYSPACPELVVVPLLSLKRLAKEHSRNWSPVLRASCSSTLEALESAATAAQAARDASTLSPRQLADKGLEPLLPPNAPPAKDRLAKRRAQRDQRRAKLLAAAAPTTQTTTTNRAPKKTTPTTTRGLLQQDQGAAAPDAGTTNADETPVDPEADIVSKLNIDDF